MKKLEYSTSALNVLRKFHRASAIIFVEGQDDLHFWKNIADKAGLENIRLEYVGGGEELKKKIELIIDEDARIIVARDADYVQLIGNIQEHPRVINTYGYSIENSMYCPNTISRFASQLARTLADYNSIIVDWYEVFSDKIEILLIYDAANCFFEKGITVFSDNCSRFLENKNSPYISKSNVDLFIETIESNFSKDELDLCFDKISNNEKDKRWLVKGHFITNAIINLVKNIVKNERRKNISISLDHLYTNTISGCSSCAPQNCVALREMVNSLNVAIATIS